MTAPDRIYINKVHGQHPEDWDFTDGKYLTKKQLAAKVEYIRADPAALDPALTERAGALTRRLRKTEEAGHVHHLSKADRLAAADLITALLTQNAALRAEAQEMGAGMVTLSHEHSMERARANAAEAREKRLRGAMIQMRDDKTGFRHAVHFRRFITAALKGNDQ